MKKPLIFFRGFLIPGINFRGSTCCRGDDRYAKIGYIKGRGSYEQYVQPVKEEENVRKNI